MFEGQGWMVWLGAALVMVGVEAATVDFTFLMLAAGALGGSVAAAFGAPFLVQAIVASGMAVVMLAVVRPMLKRRFTVKQHHAMGAEANLGRSAYVLDRVTTTSGQIKLGGETWTARTRGAAIEPGEEVVVDSIEGASAVVSRAKVIGS